MKRFFLVLVSVAALGLVVGGCKKKEDEGAKKDDKAANKPSEAKPSEAKPSEAKPSEGKPGEAKPGEGAAAGGEAAGGETAAKEGAAGGADGTGIEECDKYLKLLANCEKMPPEAKQGLQQSFQAWKTAREQANKAGGDTLKQWEEQMKKTCVQAASGWEATLKAQGCLPDEKKAK
jgi:hypothetical protein